MVSREVLPSLLLILSVLSAYDTLSLTDFPQKSGLLGDYSKKKKVCQYNII